MARAVSSSAAQAASLAMSLPPSMAVAASARPWATAWNDPIGTPNAWRSLTYSTPISIERAPMPTSALAMSASHSSRARSNSGSACSPDSNSTAEESTAMSATGIDPRFDTGRRMIGDLHAHQPAVLEEDHLVRHRTGRNQAPAHRSSEGGAPRW